jgi:hypothetical protein
MGLGRSKSYYLLIVHLSKPHRNNDSKSQTEHIGGVFQAVHELALVQTPLHLERLNLDDVQGFF